MAKLATLSATLGRPLGSNRWPPSDFIFRSRASERNLHDHGRLTAPIAGPISLILSAIPGAVRGLHRLTADPDRRAGRPSAGPDVGGYVPRLTGRQGNSRRIPSGGDCHLENIQGSHRRLPRRNEKRAPKDAFRETR
jgi:hypothetical protein